MHCTTHSAPVTRPALELADIVRACGPAYRASHRLSPQQHRVLNAVANCRTAALGGYAAQCDHCGAVTLSYRSCGNRHCPKCQTLAKERWVERHCAELLDIDYWHLVFRAASQTLLEFGRNPRWLGGELGITMVLHTWGQNLSAHIHVHCIITGGALSSDGQRWLAAGKNFLFPTAALSRVFRGKYLDFLAQARRGGELRLTGAKLQLLNDPDAFECLLALLRTHPWIVYAKEPFAGAARVVEYLGR